jgi:hypothetical protein
VRVLVRVGVARGCGRRGRHNYPTNLPLIKLISINRLIRNQEEPRNTSNHCKRALPIYVEVYCILVFWIISPCFRSLRATLIPVCQSWSTAIYRCQWNASSRYVVLVVCINIHTILSITNSLYTKYIHIYIYMTQEP